LLPVVILLLCFSTLPGGDSFAIGFVLAFELAGLAI
jgi:hypothetical protein